MSTETASGALTMESQPLFVILSCSFGFAPVFILFRTRAASRHIFISSYNFIDSITFDTITPIPTPIVTITITITITTDNGLWITSSRD